MIPGRLLLAPSLGESSRVDHAQYTRRCANGHRPEPDSEAWRPVDIKKSVSLDRSGCRDVGNDPVGQEGGTALHHRLSGSGRNHLLHKEAVLGLGHGQILFEI